MANDIMTMETEVDHFVISTFENQLLFLPLESHDFEIHLEK